MPQLVMPGIAAAVAAGTATVGQLALYAAVNIGFSVVASYAQAALAQRGGSRMSSGITLQNRREPAAPHEIVYGRVRKGGTIVYLEETGEDSKYLHMVIALAGHEVAAIEDIYLDDRRVELGGMIRYGYSYDKWTGPSSGGNDFVRTVTGTITVPDVARNRLDVGEDARALLVRFGVNVSSPSTARDVTITTKTMLDGGYANEAPWNGKVRVSKNLGSPDQAADPLLLAESTRITPAFRGRGIAYLYVRFEADDAVFRQGLPLVTAVVRGRMVGDPRGGGVAWRDNAALCLRDYIRAPFGIGSADTDDAGFAVEASVCDEAVGEPGRTRPRYTMNGIVRADERRGDVLDRMTTSCGGEVFYSEGEFGLKTGWYAPPVLTLTMDDLRGPVRIMPRPSFRDMKNVVRGTFNAAAKDWITTDFAEIRSADHVAQDAGQESVLDLPLPFTDNEREARALGRQALLRGREAMTVQADWGLAPLRLRPGSVVALALPRYGWAAKPFAVRSWRFVTDGQSGALRVALTLRETSAAAFGMSLEAEATGRNDTGLPDWRTAPQANLAPSAGLRAVNGRTIGVLRVEMSHMGAYFDQYEVVYRRSGDDAWIQMGRGSQAVFEAAPIVDGLYDLAARCINAFGLSGEWTYVVNWDAQLYAEVPPDVTGFAIDVIDDKARLRWTAVEALDLAGYRIRYTPLTSGATWTGAIDIASGTGTSVEVPAQVGTYLIRAIDDGGRLSASAAVLTTTIAGLVGLNFVASAPQHPGFAGAKAGTVVDAGLGGLRLATAGAGYAASGTYAFAAPLDLGGVFTSRVTARVLSQIYDQADNLLAAPNVLVRDWLGGTVGADVAIGVMVRTSRDAPAAGTWGPWRPLVTGDYTARSFETMLTLASGEFGVTPVVTELALTVDMPDRIVPFAASIPAAGGRVTFAQAFFVTPEVGMSVLNGQSGDRLAMTKDPAGIDFQFFNAAGAAVARQVTGIAQAYGARQP